MKLSDYDYELPEKAIAKYPVERRGDSRLLALNKETGEVQDSAYRKLGDFLREGDVLVVNNTKVLPARLTAQTERGSKRELLLLEKHGQDQNENSALVMYRRRLRVGQRLVVAGTEIMVDEVYENGTARISSPKSLWALAEQSGEVPLPPYMHRNEEPGDRERYQTEFAKEQGSVAAPTASLNLTNEIISELQAKGVKVVELTLHVGLGTFMPIRNDDITKHKMHQEYFMVPAQAATAIRTAKEQGRRVIAVGTTVTRTLEFAADDILSGAQTIDGEADIFIYPGYEFKIVDVLLTNFHAPHSTVLMMAAAFAGWEHLKSAYEHALRSDYQFLSYGDSMLIY